MNKIIKCKKEGCDKMVLVREEVEEAFCIGCYEQSLIEEE